MLHSAAASSNIYLITLKISNKNWLIIICLQLLIHNVQRLSVDYTAAGFDLAPNLERRISQTSHVSCGIPMEHRVPSYLTTVLENDCQQAETAYI